MKREAFWGKSVLGLLFILLAWQAMPQGAAAQFTFTPPPEPYGNCADCHTGFKGGGFTTGLHRDHVFAFGASSCSICHGGENAPACGYCHEVQSTEHGMLLHDFLGGPGAEGHNFHTDTVGIGDCEVCHVSGIVGGPLREPFGECASCHTGFQNGTNGPLHQDHTQNFGAGDCAICHGDNAPACNQCHDVASTDPMWSGLTLHDFRNGPGAQGHDFHTRTELNPPDPLPILDCDFCHVSGIVGGPLREPFGECASCHTGFQDGPSGDLHFQHTQEFGAGDCTICHADNAPACNECHDVMSTDHNMRLLHDFRNGVGEGHNFHIVDRNIDCIVCHVTGVPDVTPLHEVAEISCTSCHNDNLLPQHDSQCGLCHGSADPVVQEAIANNNTDCRACHGERPHALDCMLCHQDFRFEDYVGQGVMIHDIHHDDVNCGICHPIFENIPLGPPDAACGTLCHGPEPIESAQAIHLEHLDRFEQLVTPCYWCHGQNIPPRPENICDLCHQGRSGGAQTAHDIHTDIMDCTVCHETVAGFDFDVRIDSRFGICTRCHQVESGGAQEVHDAHAFGNAQCWACHGDANVYADFRGDLDCSICHGFRSDPFTQVHRSHPGSGMECAVCHSTVPPLVQGVEGLSDTEPPPPPGNEPPVAEAGPDQSVFVGDQVMFSGAQSSDPDGSIVEYRWAFGDGQGALGRDVTHVYDTAGQFTVTLQVTDNDGATDSDTLTVTVESMQNEPPVAEAGPDQMVIAGTQVAFDGGGSQDPDGTITEYRWDFGDGMIAFGANVTHTYNQTGQFIVTLQVTDDAGATDTDTLTVTVESAPVSENLALNQPAKATAAEPGFEAANAVDGSLTTRWWSSGANSKWLWVDLGSVTAINRIVVNWHDFFASEYTVYVQEDRYMRRIARVSAGDGGRDVFDFAAKQARWVYIECRVPADSAQGFSVTELEVFEP